MAQRLRHMSHILLGLERQKFVRRNLESLGNFIKRSDCWVTFASFSLSNLSKIGYPFRDAVSVGKLATVGMRENGLDFCGI
ncbi:MAG: hypothetical protein A2687_05830 [Candidatus Levybacteria bacterium RIFCSPHIGHO2_01_FULL_38_26]|nr:MAG: hypothetical protein A2687_05830 [Candidatus Levybacteria bacterium RIFCSPHIGHO2_01_FULL_38_26]